MDGIEHQRRYVFRHRDRVRQGWARRKARGIALVNAAKNKPCMDCGQTFPMCVMDFDHRDPSLKCFGIGQYKEGSVTKLLAEIAKCDVVCANCHRIRTFRLERTKEGVA